MTELKGISKILVIRLARLGDVALLLPTLASLKNSFDAASLTLMTGSPYAPLGELCPYVDKVISVDRLAMRDGSRLRALVDILKLVNDLRSHRFDLAVDFHSFRETNLLARASGARYRVGMKRSDRAYLDFCFNLPPVLEDKSIHVSEMFRRVAEAVPGVSVSTDWLSTVRVPAEIRGSLPESNVSRPSVAFYVGASVATRRWPEQRFSALIRHVAEAWSAAVFILGGASREEANIAQDIASSVEDLPGVQLFSNLSIPRMAGVISSADLLVSNDTGPMHIGSALGVPTLGIFSESLPRHYRPVGPNDRYIRKQLVADVETEDVVHVLEEMLSRIKDERRDRQPLS